MIRWLLDLIFITLLAVLAGIAMFTFTGPLRIALVLPVILFVPGYAFLSVLYPEGSRLSRSRENRRSWGRQNRSRQGEQSDDAFLLGNVERLVLSVALSLAIVSLIIFALNFTVGFGPRRIATMLFGFTGAMIIFAIARRIVLPPEERFVIEFSLDRFPMDTTFAGMFSVSLLVFAASVGFFAFAAPAPASQPSTGFTIVAENETTGNNTIQAADDAIVNGEPVTIRIDNQEGEKTSYTVVVTLETVENGNVTNTERVDQFSVTVGAGELKRIKGYDEAPSDGGDRVMFYLYKGDAQENLSRESAYRVYRVYLSTGTQEESNENGNEDGRVAPPSVFIQQPQLAVRG
jgi:uncharacterized membrane protein